MTRYISELLAPLASPGRADHRYHLRSFVLANGQTRYELALDDERMFVAPVRERLLSSLVQHVNRRAVERSHGLALHAGGVEHDSISFVFPAAMEAGKTTLAAGLVRAGLGYLTDEAVVVDPRTLMIQPYPKPFSLDPGSWDLFPEFEPHADLASDEYKAYDWQIAPDAVGRIGRSCPIGMIAFPQYTPGAETELIPMARAEALVELAKNTFRFDARPREALDVLADVVRAAECYRFTVGDLASAVELVTSAVGATPSPKA